MNKKFILLFFINAISFVLIFYAFDYIVSFAYSEDSLNDNSNKILLTLVAFIIIHIAINVFLLFRFKLLESKFVLLFIVETITIYGIIIWLAIKNFICA